MWPISVHFVLVALVALAICIGAGWLLWRGAGSPPAAGSPPVAGRPKPLTLRDQFDLVKIALSIVVGVGGLVALVVAYRRQRDSEKANRDTYHDATERRVTELYTKAADQLGSDKAPVRLAGLYSLERLAHGNPEHRQTIVNVLCAYLRMPYTPPTDPASTAENDAPAPGDTIPETTADQQRQAREEREVRLTAQRILTDHLRNPAPDASLASTPTAHWPNLDLDLTDATLMDIDFSECHARAARFDRATFSGYAWFGKARFTGDAGFDEATFTGDAGFGEATFTGDAGFSKARFTGDAGFDEATFTGDAWFDEARFTGGARFDAATFSGGALFGKATFSGGARFDEATFSGDAGFGGAAFSRGARFDEATFTGDAWFDEATFTGDAWFGKARFTGGATFDAATFTRGATFGEARFSRGATFGGATFTGDATFDGATFSRGARFDAARFSGDAGFGGATFTGGAWFDEATFSGDATFDAARFTGDATFGGATFTGDVTFDEARVENRTTGDTRAWPPGWGVRGDPTDPDRGLLTVMSSTAVDDPGPSPTP